MIEPEARAGSRTATGTLAFLFTDLAGSTQLWERLPSAMKDALERHDAILSEAIETSSGRVVKTTGDGLMAVFPTAADGVAASLAAQQALGAERWGETGPLRVRMGLHAGDADRRGDDYFGPTINRTARIMAAGHGGQVLLSAAAAALAEERLPAGASLRDLGEYRLKDLGRPERVFQLIHPALEATFPPLATQDRAAANLPIQAAPFVGRRVELADVDRRLEDPSIRLLTLTGPGGTGKTTLAIRAAGDQVERFRDGVSFVDLSSARDTDAVLIGLGRAVGVGEAPDRPLRQELTDRLRDRQVLLLLDNFEQVTAAAGVTTELLSDCPEVKLLVTSREPLHVRAEHVYAVPPMVVPPAGPAAHHGRAARARTSRSSSSSIGPGRSVPTSSSTTTTRPRSATSAVGSTACRSRSSSLRPACGCSRRRRCVIGSEAGSSCSGARPATCPSGSRPCGRRSNGATSCSNPGSSACSRSSRSLPTRTSRRWRRSRPRQTSRWAATST